MLVARLSAFFFLSYKSPTLIQNLGVCQLHHRQIERGGKQNAAGKEQPRIADGRRNVHHDGHYYRGGDEERTDVERHIDGAYACEAVKEVLPYGDEQNVVSRISPHHGLYAAAGKRHDDGYL